MSVPPQQSQRRTEIVEDCRDYLRTGRCKYGSACKYNHPANVQSGGGLKQPLDPTEPLFPIRPNEPICQYYMKHGTCKFGQACKFHHPPQSSMQAILNGRGAATVVMGGVRQAEVPPQLVVNPIGTDANGSMMLQFLPQRPEEPDCIYFLKNGRCKYGATCRYHHPVGYHQRRTEERRRVPAQDPYRSQNIQFANQFIPIYSQGGGQPGRADGQVTLVNVDGTTAIAQSFQPVTLVSSSDTPASYAIPAAEQGSSTSSIASSYDTAGSSFDLHGDSTTNALWNRARRNGSGGSLNAYNIDNTGQVRAKPIPVMHSSASDGNIARRNRSTSYGSASETTYYDTVGSLSRNTSVGSWRNDPEQPHRMGQPQYQLRSDGTAVPLGPHLPPHGGVQGRGPAGSRPMRSPRRSQRSGEDDEGFTMMTSALMNLLDTPEEMGGSYDEEQDPKLLYAPPGYPLAHDDIDPAIFQQLSLNHAAAQVANGSVHRSWSPTPRSASSGGRSGQDDALQVIQHHHANGSTHSTGSDVGLYLP